MTTWSLYSQGGLPARGQLPPLLFTGTPVNATFPWAQSANPEDPNAWFTSPNLHEAPFHIPPNATHVSVNIVMSVGPYAGNSVLPAAAMAYVLMRPYGETVPAYNQFMNQLKGGVGTERSVATEADEIVAIGDDGKLEIYVCWQNSNDCYYGTTAKVTGWFAP